MIGLLWYASRPAPEDVLAPIGDRPASKGSGLLSIVGPAAISTPSGAPESPETGPAADSPQKYEPEQPPVPRVVGRWRDHDHDNRFLTLNDDGTGMMVVTMEGLGATLFAARLELDVEWSLDGDHLTLITLGGRPKAKANFVKKVYGSHNVEEILELTKDRLLVQHNEETQFDWRRLADDDPAGLESQEPE